MSDEKTIKIIINNGDEVFEMEGPAETFESEKLVDRLSEWSGATYKAIDDPAAERDRLQARIDRALALATDEDGDYAHGGSASDCVEDMVIALQYDDEAAEPDGQVASGLDVDGVTIAMVAAWLHKHPDWTRTIDGVWVRGELSVILRTGPEHIAWTIESFAHMDGRPAADVVAEIRHGSQPGHRPQLVRSWTEIADSNPRVGDMFVIDGRMVKVTKVETGPDGRPLLEIE